MKKSLLALAVLGAFAGAAQAQSDAANQPSSSVTLYGTIDTGINYATNVRTGADRGNHVYNFSSSVMQGSRWGLRGVEDLGNGLKAIFTLESGFDVNTGNSQQGGRLFGRQAFMGLSGDFGTVTVGRQYDSLSDFVAPFAAGNRGGSSFATHPGDVDNLGSSQRINNAIKYTSLNYDGVTFGGLYSLGGTPGAFSQNQVFSLGASYANGPLALGAAYLNAKDPNTSFYGATLNNGQGANNIALGNVLNPVYGGFASARALQIIGAGGAYSFGPFTAGLTYSNTQFKKLNGNASDELNPAKYTGTATFHNAEANLSYQFAPDTTGIVAYDYTRGSNVNTLEGVRKGVAIYKQISIGVDHSLSKRAGVYVAIARTNGSGTDSTGQPATGLTSGIGQSSSKTQTALRVGGRISF